MMKNLLLPDNGCNLSHQIIDILKHGAFGGSQTACSVNMLYDFSVLASYLVKKSAQGTERRFGISNHL